MAEVLVITPVKNSIVTTLETAMAIKKSTVALTHQIYNDFSDGNTRQLLEENLSCIGYELIHLEDLIDTPSPNYKAVLQMAQKEGKAMMTLTLVEGSSLQEASSSVLKQYVMELIEAEEITVNGLKAIRMEAGQQQQETIIKTLSYVIQHGGHYYNLMGITHTESFNDFESVFLGSMNSFKELKDAEQINRKPERIRLKTVASDGTLQQVLTGFDVPKDRLEEVSLINGMSLTDPVRKGTLIKVIGE